MKMTKMTILTATFSLLNGGLFLSLFQSQTRVSLLVLNITAAMVFFALAVMKILTRAHKRQIGQLKQPMRLGGVAFALAGATGVSRSLALGLQTGAWEYWGIMLNLIAFVVGVLILWYNKFLERLLQDVRE